jgi:hypothetical protein
VCGGESGIEISPNVLSLSTLDNNTTTFSLSLPDTVVVSLFLYRSTTSFVSIPNNHSLLRISTETTKGNFYVEATPLLISHFYKASSMRILDYDRDIALNIAL